MSDTEALRELTKDVSAALSTIVEVDKHVRDQGKRIETNRVESRQAHIALHGRLDKIEITLTEHRTAVRIFRWMVAGLGGLVAILGTLSNLGRD